MPRYWMYILLLAIVTYLIRVLPLTVFHKEIKNKTVLSFLYYVPYITLAVMTFPEILHATRRYLLLWSVLFWRFPEKRCPRSQQPAAWSCSFRSGFW